MTKRARYDGGSADGVWVALDTSDVNTKFVHVKQGGLLPTQTEDGEPVPASLRDDLLKNNPDFVEHNQPEPKSSAKEGEE